MRRAILAVFAGGALLTSAACGDDPKTENAAAPAVTTPAASTAAAPDASSPAPDYTADNLRICDRVDKVISTEFKGFGDALGKMIAYKEAKDTAAADKAEKQAATELKAVATQLRKETTKALDPELKTLATTSAQRIDTSAKNLDFIERIKTSKDLDRTLQEQLSDWISPVVGHCAVARAAEAPSGSPSEPPASAAPSASAG
ncbi:hypothetical protein AB0G04_00845 [Actinoplanes sp. NPDC023801]|uniref:hypothetical protein n=1 Tax=Actinoplanes sp. NPDC023801 TaxID=3154595 RepID=UPI0033DCF65A